MFILRMVTFIFGAWNNREWAAGEQYKFVNLGSVQANTVYYLTLVHESTSVTEGTLKIYNNGVLISQVDKVGQQYAHGGGIGFGRVNGDTVFPPTDRFSGSGRGFQGSLGGACYLE